MASLNGTFDATEVAPAIPLEVLPPGKYLSQLIESEMMPTKAGDGQLLKLVFEVLEGPYARRKNLRPTEPGEPQRADGGNRATAALAICHAVEQVQVSDSEQLHFKPLIVTLKVEPAGVDKHGVHRDARNKVGGYSSAKPGTQAPAAAPRPAVAAPRPVPAAPAAPPPADRVAATAPWRRNA